MGSDPISTRLLQRQRLRLDQQDEDALTHAVVAIAGIGGVGCPAVEILARNAVSHFILADIDRYEISNARQIFMTHSCLGKEKVVVAQARILDINPEAEVQIYTQGITPSTYMPFCQGADVINNQVDQISSNIMLHYAGDCLRKPVVSASRTKWPDRHFLGVRIYDYRQPDMHFDIMTNNIEDKWGVKEALIVELMEHVRAEQDCDDLITQINTQNLHFRIRRMLEVLLDGGAKAISDKPREYLLQLAETYPTTFQKMAISPEEAFMLGCLAGTAIKDLILGRPAEKHDINLYHGHVMKLQNKETLDFTGMFQPITWSKG